jgi:hypothetical protein
MPAEKRSRIVALGPPRSEQDPEEVKTKWQLWVAPHDRIRTEFVVEGETVTAVIAGDKWWSWSRSRGARTNDGDPNSSHGVGPGEALLYSARILPALRLEVIGHDMLADRPVTEVLARPGSNVKDETYWKGHSARHGLGAGADEYLISVDTERGVLLGSKALIAGEPFRILEIESITFDEDLDDELFTPGEDEYFERVRLPRYVALSELPGAVEFTVLVPANAPFGAEEVVIHPAEGEIPETVHITFASELQGEDDRQFWLAEAARPFPGQRFVDWHLTEGMRYGNDHNVQPPLRVVQVNQLDSFVELRSYHLTMDELLALGRSLAPIA